MRLIEALNWRYATKRMNGVKVPDEKLNNILNATRLSASSMGLQPYSIIVVENEDLRKRLKPAVNNQPQITEGSHVLVFAAWENVTEQHVNDYIHHIAKVRSVSLESLEGLKNALMGIVIGRSTKEKYEWAARQAYIALGTALAAAALEKIDATPMEGFNPEEVDRILHLREKGLRSVTLLVLGYRDSEKDYLANAKKVRRSKNELFLNAA
jgi:nitroreductase